MQRLLYILGLAALFSPSFSLDYFTCICVLRVFLFIHTILQVSLAEIAEHFSGSKRDIVANLLDVLEGEFLIFRKNDLYRAM